MLQLGGHPVPAGIAMSSLPDNNQHAVVKVITRPD
jgi:hypothetical protein